MKDDSSYIRLRVEDRKCKMHSFVCKVSTAKEGKMESDKTLRDDSYVELKKKNMIRQIDNTIKSNKFVEILLNEHYYISVFQELKYTK